MLLFHFLSFFAFSLHGVVTSSNASNDLWRRVEDSRLYDDPGWLRLGHYNGSSSRIAGLDFFLAENGQSSPSGELRRTLEFFLSTDSEKSHRALCKYPARRRFLSQRLGVNFRSVSCSLYKKYKADVAAHSVSLVFSSYYLNNPASAFGHTLLRFNKMNSSELLDYSVNFAAEVDTPNSVVYAFKGLTGMFKGAFTITPYYLMVRKYNSFESRDLWSYELDLSDDEVEMLVDHIWELGSAYFDYWYLSENCSFALLAALEAAAPRLQLLDHIPFYVLPSDTIKALTFNPGLIRKVTYRPSERTQFFARYKNFSPNEKLAFKSYQHNMQLSEQLSLEESVRVLDALIDYYDYKFPKEIHIETTPEFSIKKKILSDRSHLKLVTTALDFPEKLYSRPDFSHGSARIGLGYTFDQKIRSGVDIQGRFALHDFLDRNEGYPEYAAIDFGSAHFQYFPEVQKIQFREATLVEIFSLTPFHPMDFKFSWHAAVKEESIQDKSCPYCSAGIGELGGGMTFKLSDSPAITFFQLVEGQLAGHPDFSKTGIRLGLAPRTGLRVGFKNAQFLIEGRYFYFPAFDKNAHSIVAKGAVRFALNSSWSLEMGGERQSLGWNASSRIWYDF